LNAARQSANKLVIANWKMNGTRAIIRDLSALDRMAATAPEAPIICPPATLIVTARAHFEHLRVGGQDCHACAAGAYTGSVSAALLAEAGASHVIVGHSEARQALAINDAGVSARAQASRAAGLTPIVCVGSAEESYSAQLDDQLCRSTDAIDDARFLIVAYEPLWAIGSGRPADPDHIGEVHARLRTRLTQERGWPGDHIRIVYGGSVTGRNAGAILAQPEVDGVLVGGASLALDSFMPIVMASLPAVA